MTKKLFLRLVLISAFAFSLNSCMHDDMSSAKEENHTSTFNVFQKSAEGKEPDYAKGFSLLYTKYRKLHPDFSSNLNRNQNDEKASVYFYLASQMFTLADGSKAVLYPLVKNDKVVGLVSGVLNKEEDYVSYILLSDETEYYNEILNTFTTKLNSKLTRGTTMRPADECGDDVGGCGVIEVVVITPPRNIKGNDGGNGDNGPDPYSWNGNPDGGCGAFGDCGGGNNTSNQDIINNLQNYPCAQNLVQQLPTLQNDLAIAMRQIFQNNDNYNITFKARGNMGNIDGITFSSHTNTGSFTAVISLNDQILTHATKEYILVTMYHEVVHAFLDYEKFRLGDVAFHDQYPGVIVGYDYTPNGIPVNRYTYIEGHQQLIPFLNTLQSILSAYNPNLPHDVIVAMARTGITTITPEQRQLNNNEKNSMSGNSKGTKCP